MSEHPVTALSLDKDFVPAYLYHKAFVQEAEKTGLAVPLTIAVERSNNLVSVFRTTVFRDGCGKDQENAFYAERLVKTLLWVWGGWRLILSGPSAVCNAIRDAFAAGGSRAFDAAFMARVYEHDFMVDIVPEDQIPEEKSGARPVGRHLNGCRIGFDAGGSDRKVSAVVDGQVVYSEEVIWHPKISEDPDYHYSEILEAFKKAASEMPRVDAIGVSSAGIYIDNRVMVASLFLKVPEEKFGSHVKDIYIKAASQFGNVPLEVANDGDVTALAGAIDLNDNRILGLAMGTSEAAGYVDKNGNVTGWLNELAFAPVDFNPASMMDEWSGDFGCGVKYFSQDAVIKLAEMAGLSLDSGKTPAEKLKIAQQALSSGDSRAQEIFRTIGLYLGYTLAWYSLFYDICHVLILGRVTSGAGGDLILKAAQDVLRTEFPELSGKITLHLPDESSRRVGQSIAAASLPEFH